MNMQSSESGSSTPSATLKSQGAKKASVKGAKSERKGLTVEERNRLTCTLEEIERERCV